MQRDPAFGPEARADVPASTRFTTLRRMLFGADVAAAAAAGAAAAAVADFPPYWIVALAVVAWPLLTWAVGLSAAGDLGAWATGIGDSTRLVVATLLGSWVLLVALELVGAERVIPAAVVGAAAMGTWTASLRAVARVVAHHRRDLRQRTVVVGSGVVADRLVGRLRAHDELGLDPIGFVDDDPHAAVVSELPWLGSIGDLGDVLAQHRVARVMFAFSRADDRQLLGALRTCRGSGVAVDVVPRLFEFLDGARTLDQIGGLPLLSIAAPRLSRTAMAVKRVLDVAGAVTVLALLSPVLVAAAVAIKLESRGPVLFKQTRVGRGGRHFTMYKFRSMRAGSEVLVQPDGAIVKGRDDGRVTRAGAVLRRLSLDEIPQLLNVVRGDMSLVGPRPLVLAEAAALHEEWQTRRADLRPGLTGPWQVAGRSHIPFREMIYFDYQYVSGWSLGRDIAILSATLPAVLSGRGAY